MRSYEHIVNCNSGTGYPVDKHVSTFLRRRDGESPMLGCMQMNATKCLANATAIGGWPSMPEMEKLLDASEVSQYLNVSKRKFEQLLSQGDGPRHFLIGRQRRWRHGEINEWIDQQLKESMPCTGKQTQEET